MSGLDTGSVAEGSPQSAGSQERPQPVGQDGDILKGRFARGAPPPKPAALPAAPLVLAVEDRREAEQVEANLDDMSSRDQDIVNELKEHFGAHSQDSQAIILTSAHVFKCDL